MAGQEKLGQHIPQGEVFTAQLQANRHLVVASTLYTEVKVVSMFSSYSQQDSEFPQMSGCSFPLMPPQPIDDIHLHYFNYIIQSPTD